jgi:hypothetical protein
MSVAKKGKKFPNRKPAIRSLHSAETKERMKLAWVERRKKYGLSGGNETSGNHGG